MKLLGSMLVLFPLLALANPATNAVYANYFSSTTPPGRYLRYLHANTGAERIAHPTIPGRQVLRLQLCFEKKQPSATLFWDLSPITFNHVRFRLWNPNPANQQIYLAVKLGDTEDRGYFLPFFKQPAKPGAPSRPLSAADPLPMSLTSALNRGWITYEVRLPESILNLWPQGEPLPTKAELGERAFRNLSMTFQVHNDFSAFDRPLTLLVEGLELYNDPP